MGSTIQFNDTLQLSEAQGFPSDLLNVERHRTTPIRTEEVQGRVFEFRDKDGARIYHPPPVRVFLVQNIGGKWLFWGRILIVRQTIEQRAAGAVTSGAFVIERLYDPRLQEIMTIHDSPPGKSYFPCEPS